MEIDMNLNKHAHSLKPALMLKLIFYKYSQIVLEAREICEMFVYKLSGTIEYVKN